MADTEPNGCEVCGEIKRTHGLTILKGKDPHYYVEPPNEVRLARMTARASTSGHRRRRNW